MPACSARESCSRRGALYARIHSFPVPDKNGAMLYNEKNMNSLLKGVRSVAVGMGMGQKEITIKYSGIS